MLVKSPSFSPSIPFDVPLIAVDIGNSRVKFACFDAHSVVQSVWVESRLDYAGLADWLASCGAEAGAIGWGVSSVNDLRYGALERWITENRPRDRPFVHRITRHDIPLRVDVEEPDAVGIDRLLVACAAVGLFGRTQPNLLVVDVGTAVTADLLIGATFCGGAILPGLSTAAYALHELTERLPLLDAFSAPPPSSYPGRNTVTAMEIGVRASVIGAVRMCTDAAMRSHNTERLPIVLAGGSAVLLREEMLERGFDLLDYPDFPDLLPLGIIRCIRRMTQ